MDCGQSGQSGPRPGIANCAGASIAAHTTAAANKYSDTTMGAYMDARSAPNMDTHPTSDVDVHAGAAAAMSYSNRSAIHRPLDRRGAGDIALPHRYHARDMDRNTAF